MTKVTASGPQSELLFGNSDPTSTTHSDNDTFMVTSNGTSTGNVISVWKFDADTEKWVQIPTGGGSNCPAPMTASALRSLRNSAKLSKDCHYIVSDYSRGEVGPSLIILHALDAGKLSQHVSVSTGHDNTAWEGRYDIDTNRLLELRDQIGNVVIGENAVDNFPWGVSQVNEVSINEGVFNYTSGNVSDVEISRAAYLTVSSGNVTNSTFLDGCDVEIANCDFRYNTVSKDATVRITTSGDVISNSFGEDCTVTLSGSTNCTGNTFQGQCNVQAASSTIYRNLVGNESRITATSTLLLNNTFDTDCQFISTSTRPCSNNGFGSQSVINMSGTAEMDNSNVGQSSNVRMSDSCDVIDSEIMSSTVTLSGASRSEYNTVKRSTLVMTGGRLVSSHLLTSSVTISSGTNSSNVFKAGSTYRQVGSGVIEKSSIEAGGSWINGDTTINNTKCWNTSVNTTGSSGQFRGCLLTNATMTNCKDVVLLDLVNVTVDSQSYFTVNGATRVYMRTCTITAISRILVSAGKQLDVSYSELQSAGYIQLTDGKLVVTYSTLSEKSSIRHSSTGSNRVESSRVEGQGYISFANSVNNCRVAYSAAISRGYISHLGTSSNSWIYYSTSSEGSHIYTRDNVTARIYYCKADVSSYLYAQGNTAPQYIYYCNANSRSYVSAHNNTVTMRIYGIKASTAAVARLQNCVSQNCNFYYSSFDSYYRFYLTRTSGTSQAYHGYGRRTLTVTDPSSATGSHGQNF